MGPYSEPCANQSVLVWGIPYAASSNNAITLKQHCSVLICSLCCGLGQRLNRAETFSSAASSSSSDCRRNVDVLRLDAATQPLSSETGARAELLCFIESILIVDKQSYYALRLVSVTMLTVLNVYVFIQVVVQIVRGEWYGCQTGRPEASIQCCQQNDRREVRTLKTDGPCPSESCETACTQHIRAHAQNELSFEVRPTPLRTEDAQHDTRNPVQETSSATHSTQSRQETLEQRPGQGLNCRTMQGSEMPRDTLKVADRHPRCSDLLDNAATATCGDLQRPLQVSPCLPVKLPVRKLNRTRGKITTLCLQESLQKASASIKERRKEELKSRDTSSSEERATEDSNILKELTSARTMRFAPGVQQKVTISMCKGSEEQKNPLEAEHNRLASFQDYRRVPKSGIWVTKLAAAGFYCKDKDSPIVWCAFCDLRIEVEVFRKEDPIKLHRRRSPSCPFVQGKSSNVSIERQGQIAGLNVIHSFFGDADQPGKQQEAAEAKYKETPVCATVSKKNSEALQSACSSGFRSEVEARMGQSFAASSTSITSLSLGRESLSSSPGGFRSGENAERIGQSSTPSAREIASSPPRSQDSQSSRTSLLSQSSHSPGQVSSLPGGASSAVNRNTQVGATLHEQSSHHSSAQVGRQRAGEVNATAGNAGPQTPRPDLPVIPQAQASSASAQPSESARSQNSHVTPQSSLEPGRTHTRESALPFQTAQPVSPLQPETNPSGRSSSSQASAQNNSRQSNGGEAASHPQALPPATGEPVRQVVTYSQLGIYTQEPKRSDFAIAATRVASFTSWCHCDTHSPEEMAEAGFYQVVGQGDLVRCFYCKGGLKSWAPHLRPWVEHARFFPKCPFIGQVKGQDFIDVVQELKERQETISAEEVEEELLARQRNSQAGEIRAQLGSEGAVDGVTGAEAGEENTDVTQLSKAADDLENENKEIMDSRICKICQINDVSILFLPCGHLVSCAQCAPALRTCAICRQRVKGRVRVVEK